MQRRYNALISAHVLLPTMCTACDCLAHHTIPTKQILWVKRIFESLQAGLGLPTMVAILIWEASRAPDKSARLTVQQLLMVQLFRTVGCQMPDLSPGLRKASQRILDRSHRTPGCAGLPDHPMLCIIQLSGSPLRGSCLTGLFRWASIGRPCEAVTGSSRPAELWPQSMACK